MNRTILKTVLHSDIIEGPLDAMPDFAGLSVDSRTLKKGDLFFAIVGDNNDGHDYIANVFSRGASAAVISRNRMDEFKENPPGLIYVVNDTHEALLNLAAYIRRQIDARFAAVTGSNGKTTTKEMLYSILKVSNPTFRSPGNLNNLFGLPLSLGMMPEDAKYAVFELGMSTPGELTQLASIIKPELAIITNIGPAHLETMKTIENIVKAKFELIENLPVGAEVILNADDKYLMAEAKRRNLKFTGFGIDNETDFTAKNISAGKPCEISFTINNHKLTVPASGKVNIYNALAAVAASSIWGYQSEQWIKGLAAFRPADMRMTVEEHEGLSLLIDCYNANPASTKASIDTLANFDTKGKRIAILGDMLELGEKSKSLHYEVGRYIFDAGIDMLIALGPLSKNIISGAIDAGMDKSKLFHGKDHQEILDHLLNVIMKNDLLLIKGSRGMQMEKIITGLKGTAFKNN